MRRAFHKIVSLMLALIVVAVGGVTPALATDVDFNGQGATNVWQYDSLSVTAYGYDLFGAVTKDLAPGDTRSLNVLLRNNTPDDVDFRLVARSLSLDEVRMLETYYPGKTADDSLLDDINLRVSYGATILYSGALRGAGSAALYTSAGVAIGRLSAGYAGTITVELSLPSTLGNDTINKLCAVE
ncbi:MAG: hypothetical protein LBI64_08525 [Coriobacteriales bacterium]|jgi:hypothetical protein|nr:hypothetical protein [Coriobacteriales bacterium]